MITWAERAKAAIAQKGQSGTAKTDETAALRLLTVSAVPTEAVSAKPEQLSSVLTVPSPAILEKHDSFIAVTEDPDRWCWPHSSAMNGAEIPAQVAGGVNLFRKMGTCSTWQMPKEPAGVSHN